jgi:hypothetical protein
MIGQAISPLLSEIEECLWDYENHSEHPPGFTEEGFRASLKIFSLAFMEYIWNLSEKEGIPLEQRCDMAKMAGQKFKELIKTYADINTEELYK